MTVERIVEVVLYEGYALYPYRPSALKNQRRFAFGAVYPAPWAKHAHEPWHLRAECTMRGDEPVAITVRFLVLQRGGGAQEEAIALEPRAVAEAGTWRTHHVRQGIDIEIEVAVIDERIAVEIENVTAIDPAVDIETAMDVTLASTHVIFRGGTAVSSIDPPPELAARVAACRTNGLYCVVVARDTILASPIVLPDFPEIAPESPGDFFDGTEMDEMLTLRVLTMTPEEKAEAATANPKIAALLERTEQLGFENTAKLHGTWRSTLAAGMRVRVHPKPGADAFDTLLAGKLATIVKVERDLDGRVHCGVTIDEDPGADLGVAGMPGHRFFFRPDELERIP